MREHVGSWELEAALGGPNQDLGRLGLRLKVAETLHAQERRNAVTASALYMCYVSHLIGPDLTGWLVSAENVSELGTRDGV